MHVLRSRHSRIGQSLLGHWFRRLRRKCAYATFAESYSCDHGIDSPDDIRAAAERVEDLGEAFGVDVYAHKAAMREEATEKEKKRPAIGTATKTANPAWMVMTIAPIKNWIRYFETLGTKLSSSLNALS